MNIKICGMKYADNIQQIAELQPQYLGFIFYEKSPRNVEAELPFISENIKKTGVFVNASLQKAAQTVEKYDLQAVQLHGSENPDFCNELKQMQPNIEIIKAFSVAKSFDFSNVEPYSENVDYYLFDTKGKLPGGNGTTFNWNLLRNYPFKKPFFVSGGIGMEQIDQIKELCKYNLPIYAFDVNSRFEIDDGLKNEKLLLKFMNELKELTNEN